MIKKLLTNKSIYSLFLFTLILSLTNSECTNKPSCFQKKLFNFNYPKQKLYPITINQNQNNQYQVKAYGDFNNDLNTDFIALNSQLEIQIYVWNRDKSFFSLVATVPTAQNCVPSNIYLYDINQDGYLDFTIWGTIINPEQVVTNNCIVPFVRLVTNNQAVYMFQNTTYELTNPTTNPILFTFPFQNNIETIGLLLFLNGSRSILKYRSISVPVYELITWQTLFGTTNLNIGFHQPHWNTFVDLTGDCRSDLVVYNANQQIQIWINRGRNFSLNNVTDYANLKSLTFNDLNYDGAPDIIIANSTFITCYLNTKIPDSSDLCCQNCQTLNFNFRRSIVIEVQNGQTIQQQSLHFTDLNIDGFPDISLILTSENGQTTTPTVYVNNFMNSESFGLFQQYNSVIQDVTRGFKTLTISYIDILENGIIDFMVVVQNPNGNINSISFYNNYLYQNFFFIKGFGVLGPQNNQGVQFPGLTFYWINSVNDGERITYQGQITQTAYDSLQMPYAFSGLGRANNYVQSFTLGKNGQKKIWSPIIPNSQLGVFTVNGQTSQWVIRIFVLPTQSLIYVIIVAVLILGILGLILLYFKCKMYRKKPESPLMMEFIS